MSKRIKGLWKVLFGRTTIFVLLILIQLTIIFAGAVFLGYKIILVNNIVSILALLIMIYIMNARQNASFKLMWIILVLATPLIGVPFYIFTRIQPRTVKLKKSLEDQICEQREYLLPKASIIDKIYKEAGDEYGLFKYIYEEATFPPHDDCGFKYFPQGEDKFEELMYQIEQAKDFIFLEYFIIDRGEMWGQILALLIEKVQEGVDVRLIYDGTNSMMTLPAGYHKKLAKFGIKCHIFSPMRPFLTTHQNNRDHRKIVVIDGHTAFTGGINLSDEYINSKERFGHWKDTAIMVKGKAVESFTLMFLRMWNIDNTEKEDYSRFMYKGHNKDIQLKYGGFASPYGSSPFEIEQIGQKVYLDIINKASEYVHITSPYLIPDDETINALVFAAKRGVDVKLILPHVPDKKYAYLLARTYYGELISSGVKIYEYTPGFVHAKMFTSDDVKAVVGTINLDFRSLYLHFECAVYIWNNPIVGDIEEDFQQTLAKCQRITRKNCDDYPLVKKICGGALRLIAPLM